MTERIETDPARLQAINHVATSIDPAVILPKQVFIGNWCEFLFCESDRVFSEGFAETVSELMAAERATACCLVNFDLAPSIEDWKTATIFLDEATTEIEYMSLLKEGGPSAGWLYAMQRHGCASDMGEWCIYAERMNDIAIVGLRNENGVAKFSSPLRKLYAHSIRSLLQLGPSSPIPFSNLAEHWKLGLLENYSHGQIDTASTGSPGAGSPTL